MTHHADPREIEKNLERERNALGSALEELQDRFSTDSLAREALGMIKTNAAAYTQSIDRAVRANPVALALTGVGLAWLIFGGRRVAITTLPAAIDRWEDEGGNPLPEGFEPALASVDPAEGRWAHRIDVLRHRASAALRRLERDARGHAGAVRDVAAERNKLLAAFTDDMREAMSEGLDDLSASAREKIVKARESAYAARLKLDKTVRAGSREVERMINEHPLVAGAVALAVGAAVAAALPRTRAEDRTFGCESDRLMAAAANLLREERERISRVAGGVADELKVAAQEARGAVAEGAADVVARVKERAQAEAARTPSPGQRT